MQGIILQMFQRYVTVPTTVCALKSPPKSEPHTVYFLGKLIPASCVTLAVRLVNSQTVHHLEAMNAWNSEVSFERAF
jgi:hypothetical protein